MTVEGGSKELGGPEGGGAGKVEGGRRKHFTPLVYLYTTSRWHIV